jgi:beta-ribofuranosylaminobenzene 5'-phosphate synthase
MQPPTMNLPVSATLLRMHTSVQDTVTVRAPGRLHLGFLDPSGSLGRRFGSVGLVIEGFATEVEFGPALVDRVTADTPEGDAQIDRALAHLGTLQRLSGHCEPVHVRLINVLPSHAGFGSGTQLALAIGRGFACWHGLDVDTPTLAHWLGRGLRSGIGIHGFDQGGLLVDGGPGADGRPAPLLARVALPPSWRVVVVQDSRERGLAGGDERAAIAALAPMSGAQAADICHQVLMRVLVGAAGDDFEAFAAGVTQVQRVLGEHYAPVQQGRPYTSAAVGRLMRWVVSTERRGDVMTGSVARPAAAIGQSSWGPTGFAIVASQAQAEALATEARAAGLIEPGMTLNIVAARAQGAEIIDTRVARRARHADA